MALTATQVHQFYVGYYGRPADTAGLAYWQNQTESAALAGFSGSAEFTNQYAGLTTTQDQVTKVYNNLLGRAPDADGLAYWSGEITAGRQTLGTLLLSVIKNAQGKDVTTIADRVAYSTSFSAALDTLTEINAYNGTTATNLSRVQMGSIVASSVGDHALLVSATAAIDSTIATIVNGGTPSGTVALTAGVDNITGTAANETITGTISTVATATTFNSTDNIIDTSSTDADVLTVTIEADVTATNSGLVRGIETINVNANATTLAGTLAAVTTLDFDATNFSNAKALNFDVTKAATAVDILSVTALAINNATVTASDDFVTTTVAATGGTGQNLTVDAKAVGSAGSATFVTVTGAIADVAVTGAGYLNATSNASTGLLSATAAKSLTLSGTAAKVIKATATDGNVTISDATASVNTTVNATGNVSIASLSAAGKLNVVAGGTIGLTGVVGATSAVLSGVGASSSAGTANALTSLSISGNGGAATYDFTAGSTALVDVAVSGDKNVGLKLSAASVETGSSALNVVDTGTGTFTLELGTAAGAVDLRSGNLIDSLVVNVDNANKALSVKTGQTVTYKTDQVGGAGATSIVVGTAAAEAANTVTVKLDDAVRDSNAVDLTKLTITQAKTVTIDASTDTSAAGAAVKHVIGTLDASAAKSNVTINMGVNNLELATAGASTVSATGSITVTGSGTLTDAATVTSLTAGTLDASAMTGAVELDSTTTLAVGTIKTGSANDKLVLTATADTAVQTGLGNDTVTLAAVDYSDKVVNIDLGDGTLDTLKFQTGSKLIKGTSGTVSLAGVETIEFADGANQEIQGALLNGKTYNVVSAATGNINTVAVKVASSETAVDLSKLVGSAAVETSVAAMTFTTNASANTSATAIKGVAAAKNNITGSSVGGDSLVGGSKVDTFNYASSALLFNSNALLDTISGGDGNDIINFTATGTAVTVAATDSWANASSVEQITTATNSAVISLTLGATAQTAGINTIDLSGDTGADVAPNVINVSAFTTGVTITGALLAGVDNITGGSGNDTIVYKAIDDLNNAGTFFDSVVGGDGTDTLLLGTSAGGFSLTAATSFVRVSSVETIKTVASTTLGSIAVNADAYVAGIRTIDVSAGTAATGNVIDANAITGGGLTLIGSATGQTSITGGSGNDVISGGSVNDTFIGGAGNDSISLVAGGTDKVTLSTVGGYDTITGFTAGANTVTGYDKLAVAAYTTLADAAAFATATHDITVTKDQVTEFNYILTGTALAISGDGSGLIAALKTVTGDAALVLTSVAGETGFLVAYQAGNAYVYSYNNAAGVTIDAGEITLVGVLNGVAAGALVSDNFIAI
ncbi:MAG: DUF4214 domain-containing protein [Burkholderiaceae bacterium]|nr:DUF4214 domain-containing protein [Burkholderiaceae bacterium]